MKFSGKTLLVLGSNVSAPDIVRYAKDNGAHTIVADYYPESKSAAKRVADESLLVSTADVDTLDEFVKTRRVDGVLAGIGEFNLLNAMELCERNGLPFYCTRDQWDAISTKDRFRELCEQYEVPCPQTYYSGQYDERASFEAVRYPAVLKPVDASTSAGVHICHSRKDLEVNLPDALSNSLSGRVIIEQFCEGDEFTAHFTVVNGKATLSCMDNRYPVRVHEGEVTSIPVARIYPSLYLDEFQGMVSKRIERMLEGIGLTNAVAFVQGLYDPEKGSFAIFEAGLRSAGEAPYRFIDKINGINYIEILVDNALSVRTSFDQGKEDPSLKERCCGIVSFVARGGVVGSIEGLEEAVSKCPRVLECESRYPVGSETPNGDTLHQLMIRFVMLCESRKQMAEDIAFLNESVSVKDVNGNNLVIKMTPNRVFGTQ